MSCRICPNCGGIKDCDDIICSQCLIELEQEDRNRSNNISDKTQPPRCF